MNDYWQARCFIERQVCSIFSVKRKNGGIQEDEYRRWGNSYGVYFAKTRSPRILAKAISN